MQNTKSSRLIYRESTSERLQFWASCLEDNGEIAMITTNLPVAEGEDGELIPQRCDSEKYGVALNAVRLTAEERPGSKIKTLKCVVRFEDDKLKVSVVKYNVVPFEKNGKYVYDMTREAYYEGGFPEGMMFSAVAIKQLEAFGLDPKNHVGVQAKLKVAKETSSDNRKLQDAIRQLSAVWPKSGDKKED